MKKLLFLLTIILFVSCDDTYELEKKESTYMSHIVINALDVDTTCTSKIFINRERGEIYFQYKDYVGQGIITSNTDYGKITSGEFILISILLFILGLIIGMVQN